MWYQINFKDGSNPYICKTNEELFRIACKYVMVQVGERTFLADPNEGAGVGKTYLEKKEALRNFAIEWQADFPNFCYSWGDVIDWGDFFSELGKKYGLLREFRENGIC